MMSALRRVLPSELKKHPPDLVIYGKGLGLGCFACRVDMVLRSGSRCLGGLA